MVVKGAVLRQIRINHVILLAKQGQKIVRWIVRRNPDTGVITRKRAVGHTGTQEQLQHATKARAARGLGDGAKHDNGAPMHRHHGLL
jgi:hypothetical protein